MQKVCAKCSSEFSVEERHLTLLGQISPIANGVKYLIPPPSLCPECRLQRRLAYRNQLYVYPRPSSLSGKRIFSAYPEQSPLKVWGRDEWWSDSWDAVEFGREFNFDSTFFAQFGELRSQVPHICNAIAGKLENSDFGNNLADTKNCYLIFATAFAEDCMYCESVFNSKDCIECTLSRYCELCYDCAACNHCYNVHSSAYSDNCRDSYFLLHCRNCTNCYGCANLRHAEYCIFNQQVSKDGYLEYINGLPFSSYQGRQNLSRQAAAFWHAQPIPHAILRNVENSSGNFLVNSKNVSRSFFVEDSEDIDYCYLLYAGCKDCLDSSFVTKGIEATYEFVQGFNGAFNIAFCQYCVEGCANLLYCSMCFGCQDCFGCIGLRKKQYCILNRQYSKEDYEKTLARIIEQMQRTGEWGEFFPLEQAPIPYNHSFAQRHFPLSASEANRRGLWWYDKPLIAADNAVGAEDLPDGLPVEAAPLTVKSALSRSAFRITAEELKRYRQLNVPLPRLTYDERMNQRSPLLGGLRLYERRCARTGRRLLSPWSPDLPWTIWDSEEYYREFC